jgi:hypothetical protein
MSATPTFNPQQVMFDQMGRGAGLFESLPDEAKSWWEQPRPGSADAMQAKFEATTILYNEVMRILRETRTRQKASLEIIGRIREELRRVPADSNRAHQLETLLRYLIGSMQVQDNQRVDRELSNINRSLQASRGAGGAGGAEGEEKEERAASSLRRGPIGRRSRIHRRQGGGKSKTRKASKKTGKKRKGGYKFTRAANSRRSLRMKTRKLKSLTQKSPKKKQKKKHGKKHGKKHDKKSKSRKARKGKHHKRGKRR